MRNKAAPHPPKGDRKRSPRPVEVTPEVERAVGISVDELAALYLLDSLKGFGPQKFRELWEAQLRPTQVLANPALAMTKGRRWDQFRNAIARISDDVRIKCHARAVSQVDSAHRLGAHILTYDSPHYPRLLRESNNPVAPLYVRAGATKGPSLPARAAQILQGESAVACVGSRGIRPPYSDLHATFARVAAKAGYTVVSGFALGADTIGHKEALGVGGATVAVMPCGLDRPFPPENRGLWDELLSYDGAVFVSEFPFGTRAASLTLRKRNRLIVAFARAVLVSQSAVDGGAMNAYRFALEQKKPVATFAADKGTDTTGNALISAKIDDRLIIQEGRTFPLSADKAEYERWLRTLSSST